LSIFAGEFVIRAAEIGDLPDLLALYRSSTQLIRSWTAHAKERFEAILAQPGMTIFVGVAGQAAASSVTLVIVPNLTRNGASYALIENVCHCCPPATGNAATDERWSSAPSKPPGRPAATR